MSPSQETKRIKGEDVLAAKRPREKEVPERTKEKNNQNPFLCVVPACQIVVTAHVFGFSRETALLDHYKMHLKKGEVTKFAPNSLVDFCECGGIKLKAQACRACG